MMEDSNDINDELEKSRSHIGELAKNVSATVENLVKELQKEKLANKNLQNECDQKDTQIESLNLELTELKQGFQSFLSGMGNLIKTSTTPEIVPKQIENVQRAEISHSNVEEEQINDQMPDQQAVQTPDGQLPIFPQSEVQEQQQQLMEVTQLVRFQGVPISDSNEGIEQIHDQIPGHAVQTTDGQLPTFPQSAVQEQLMEVTQFERAEISLSNDEEEQVSDPMSDQQADSQLKTISEEQEQQQQPIEVTEHESIIAHPMKTFPTQVLSQPVVKKESSCHDENDNTNLQEPEIDIPIFNEKDPLEDATTTTTMGQTDAEKNSKARNFKKKYKCDECDASFFGRQALAYHIDKIHIKCDYCEKAFKKRSHMLKHINNVHLKLKPYTCNECEKTFSLKGNLQQHIQMVHLKIKPFKCQYCEHMFGYKRTLQKHISCFH